MAMYYYARKLQKSARKSKNLPQTPANGSIPSSFSITNGSQSASCFDNFNELKATMEIPDQPSTSSMGTNGLNNHSDDILVCDGPNLVSGTLEALIDHLIPSETNFPNRAYIFAFILSSRLYIPPHELLGRVFQAVIEDSQQSQNYQILDEENVVPLFVKLLAEWTELFPHDFRDEKMMAHVRGITHACVSLNSQVQEDVSQLLTQLLSQLTALERYEECLHRINTEASIGEPIAAPSVLTVCSNPTLLAEQLTHVELERLSHIGPEEFVQSFARESTGALHESRFKEVKRTRNFETYTEWFKRLGYYVASEIAKVAKKKSRIRLVEYWIEVARECYNIGNFNSLMAILTGLNLPPVSRLKKTWTKINCEQLNSLEQQLDASGNFSSYRATLKAALWQSAEPTDERRMVVMPYFALLIKDMCCVHEGCATKLPNGHINFERFWQLAKQVTEVIAWQQITCPFQKVQVVFNSVQTSPIFTEDELYLASYECEAPDNNKEKEQLKQLRQKYCNLPIIPCKASPDNGTESSGSTAINF